MDAICHGRYPADVITYLGADGPVIKESDMTDISEPVDFVGVNYYTGISHQPETLGRRQYG